MSAEGRAVLDAVVAEYRSIRRNCEKALAQVSDEAFFAVLDPESNSLAVIVKHVGGNLRSRWQDFLAADGEKPDRNRDGEFVSDGADRARIMAVWAEGWEVAERELQALTPGDLLKTVAIRSEPHAVPLAVVRNLTHTSHHAGQIVLLAKHLVGASWQTISVPRGGSEAYNQRVREKFGKG